MSLLHAGVDTASIALWLGHANIQTTQVYLHADLELKRRALDRPLALDDRPPARYQASDALIAFLKTGDTHTVMLIGSPACSPHGQGAHGTGQHDPEGDIPSLMWKST